MKDDLNAVASNFAERAQSHCGAIDSVEGSSLGEWLTRVHVTLADVYLAGLMLPDVTPINDDIAKAEGRSLGMFEKLRDHLGEHDVYRMVWDPLDQEGEAILAHLSDDLSDVYGDLSEGLDLMESGEEHPADVIWNWRDGFTIHWGRHATDAMVVIHNLRYSSWL